MSGGVCRVCLGGCRSAGWCCRSGGCRFAGLAGGQPGGARGWWGLAGWWSGLGRYLAGRARSWVGGTHRRCPHSRQRHSARLGHLDEPVSSRASGVSKWRALAGCGDSLGDTTAPDECVTGPVVRAGVTRVHGTGFTRRDHPAGWACDCAGGGQAVSPGRMASLRAARSTRRAGARLGGWCGRVVALHRCLRVARRGHAGVRCGGAVLRRMAGLGGWRVWVVALVGVLVGVVGVGAADGVDGVDGVGGRFGWPFGVPHPVVRGFSAPASPYGPGHRGVDLGGVVGEAVFAAGDGTVVFAGAVGGRSVVSVGHGGGLRTTYEPVEPVVRAGSAVRRGERIGTLVAGHEGCPRPACLHWGARRGVDYVNPLRLVTGGRVRLLPVTPTDNAEYGGARSRRAEFVVGRSGNARELSVAIVHSGLGVREFLPGDNRLECAGTPPAIRDPPDGGTGQDNPSTGRRSDRGGRCWAQVSPRPEFGVPAAGVLAGGQSVCSLSLVRRRSTARVWSWQTRDSVTPRTLPISARVRFSK
ncbi:peptidase M23-like protein [Umezawaea tangerina]|uniref:Peptidase M23-like protein n=1 Tax=Umezawaea tangerina TaxID=84725 RepID=A0A2T0TAF3_9PSEU|nr:peptidase M23-like protein [Umezawaea tangerina]